MQSTAAPAKRSTALAFVLACAPVLLVALMYIPDLGDDTLDYLHMMNHEWDKVVQPFSARFLHPWLVSTATHASGTSLQTTAIVIDLAAFVGSVLALIILFRRLRLPVMWLPPLMFSYAVVHTVSIIYMPDQFYTALLSVFLLALAFEQLAIAALLIIVLFCARESTLVLGLVAAGVFAWRARRRSAPLDRSAARREYTWAVLFFAATIAGFLVNRYGSNHASNVHHINPLLYLAVKAPYNFVKNILGVQIWTNTFVATQGDHPIYRWPLPRRLHLGGIDTIGISDMSPVYPLNWLISIISTFGVMLTVVLQSIARRAQAFRNQNPLRRVSSAFGALLRGEPFVVQFAGAYGIINFLLVPLLGSAVHRYIYYAWPGFWIFAPVLLARRYDIFTAAARPALWTLLVIHLALAWSRSVQLLWPDSSLFTLAVLAAVVVLQVFAWRLLARLEVGAANTGAAPTAATNAAV
ncbi:MAG TPA: hypothetical protein VLI90_08840 [Tepidisphaeraceae bacterium]|nr:hypothetical protein [Tepidisphaeraceae bacterium]